jgi:hypothetical protein
MQDSLFYKTNYLWKKLILLRMGNIKLVPFFQVNANEIREHVQRVLFVCDRNLHPNVISKYLIRVSVDSETESNQSRNSNSWIGNKTKARQMLLWKRAALNRTDMELCKLQSLNFITERLQFCLSFACFGTDISMITCAKYNNSWG